MESRDDNVHAALLAVLLHAGVLALIILSSLFSWADREATAAGEPIQASLQFSAADLRHAQQAIKASSAPAEKPKAVPKVQPLPSPNPQTSETPIQPTPQAPQEHPELVDQQAIDRNAMLKAEQDAKEQEEKHRQEQVDLTEDIKRRQEVERKQRLLAQYEAIKAESAAAAKQTHMEEQRLKQLADLSAAASKPAAQAASTPPPGNRGNSDANLLARYKAALNATARANWNTVGVPELTRCIIRFTQIPGGEVINIEFRECPYDPRARETVERALRKTPMPYSGFEPVFMRQVELELCTPEEECQQ